MYKILQVMDWMEDMAPLALSESWDNTGLLMGSPHGDASRIQCCLTLTLASVEEAISKKAQLIIAHHPLPFKPLAKITTESLPGRMLWDLATAGCAIYAPHTAWDSAPRGINALLAEKLSLEQVRPLIPAAEEKLAGLGAGRIGTLPTPVELSDVVERLRDLPGFRGRVVDCGKSIQRIAIACGSGGSLLGAALEVECDLFLTGEATFHTCLEAEAAEVSLLMLGHFASERFAMEHLASQLQGAFPDAEVWASERESDPVGNVI